MLLLVLCRRRRRRRRRHYVVTQSVPTHLVSPDWPVFQVHDSQDDSKITVRYNSILQSTSVGKSFQVCHNRCDLLRSLLRPR